MTKLKNTRCRTNSTTGALGQIRLNFLRTGSILLCTVALLLFFACSQKDSVNKTLSIAADYLGTQYASLSDDGTLYEKAFNKASRKSYTVNLAEPKPLYAGIVSHHLFIADLIADYFIKIAITTNPRKIILMGPNHRARGKTSIATSRLPWKTPYGTLNPHRTTIESMISAGVVTINDDAFFLEHSIGALAPFIQRVFPNASIIPLVLLGNSSKEACDRLSDWLVKQMDDETLLLASLDFSHYKTAAVAEREDSVTLSILKTNDFERAKDAYVDSKPILRVLLRTLKKKRVMDWEIVHHTNSGFISGVLNEPCTSYINMFWRYPSPGHHKKQSENQNNITFLFAGDILLHPSIARHAYSKEQGKYIFDDLFFPITSVLKKADIVVANLEGTFAGTDNGLSSFPRYNYPDELAVALNKAGFNTISLGNNHAADTGCEGLKRTTEILLANNIQPVGLRSKEPFSVSEFNNVRYSILTYTYGINYGELLEDCDISPVIIDAEVIRRDIFHSQNAGAQIILVFLHCGIEYSTEVEPWLKRLVSQIAKMGADAIICTHPHVTRSWEWIKTGNRRVFVHYSLGNLLSSHSDPLYNQGELVVLFFEKTVGEYFLKDIDIVKINTKPLNCAILYRQNEISTD